MFNKYEVGALILRIFLGLTFFIHGLVKFQGGIGNTAGFFENIGLPGFSAYVVAIIELVGGLALIVGLGTRVVSILFAIIMVVAIFTVKLPAGFLGTPEMAGYELDLALLVISIYLAIAKSSLFSVDNVLYRSK
ncbi:DoxX family protein [Halalkalibacter nanhaiisediminis]|uniref:Putative membrane protein YphA (DoxX/SURF4 family) n=1 Tax=Halalkalibacter nanhaiisediminis TaxID=688079 RepID=A0A562QBD7_9BACI|nr:DoxX family protein [Halalkalibacter nanhaiisediminis]TWI54067.1 putative membrane protein YphA (DoxX/SURF4 family) [Halalkalibacter nanhaiisediminis]